MCKQRPKPLTNFALSTLLTAEHALMSVWQETSPAKETAKALARLHRLHGKVLSHGFRNRVNVFAGFKALLRQKFNLGASVAN